MFGAWLLFALSPVSPAQAGTHRGIKNALPLFQLQTDD